MWWILAAAVLALAGAALGWWWQSSGSKPAELKGDERAAVEAVIRDYILQNPEILPEAMQRLQDRAAAQQIAALRGELERPFPGAVLGNPNGKVTLVEFTDYACTYCRASIADLDALTDAHRDLRVVIRELPILSPASAEAAKMGLAAARQGRYAEFHDAMFAGPRPDAGSIAAAAGKAGLDMAEARKVAASGEVEAELRRNMDLANRLGLQGTPGWVIGDQLLMGAVGRQRLEEAIESARRRG